MEEDFFHIDFERSGGFTGSSTRMEVHSRDMDPEQAEALKQLIKHAGFFEAFVLENSFVHMPDQFSYRITVEHMGKSRTLALTDGSMPELFRPLVNYLVALSRKKRRSG